MSIFSNRSWIRVISFPFFQFQMSSAYSTAPPTKGKVILHTTLGPLEIELWSKESPLAVRNFVQLWYICYSLHPPSFSHIVWKDTTTALSSIESSKIFVVLYSYLGFFIVDLVQGGDPTGTGLGGQSIYPKPVIIQKNIQSQRY